MNEKEMYDEIPPSRKEYNVGSGSKYYNAFVSLFSFILILYGGYLALMGITLIVSDTHIGVFTWVSPLALISGIASALAGFLLYGEETMWSLVSSTFSLALMGLFTIDYWISGGAYIIDLFLVYLLIPLISSVILSLIYLKERSD
ncbi:MAG: hypothetical protein L0213_07675 [Candidatus Dadabacteria bacterium]|nr:hypothetical protein [Candidatus Dadabacteria bacterium]